MIFVALEKNTLIFKHWRNCSFCPSPLLPGPLLLDLYMQLTLGFKNAAPFATASRGAGPSYG